MNAVVFRKGQFQMKEIGDLQPNKDQLLVEPLAIGICGSDLSAVAHTEDFLESVRKAGSVGQAFDPNKDLVLGHEFTAKVIEVGDNVIDYQPGDLIVVLPWVIGDDGVMYTVGYSNDYPGGFSERVLVGNGGHFKIPDGVNPYHAAVTEPLATGYNSVLRADIGPDGGAIVTGAGTVGLGAVIALASRGIHPIVVSDPSVKRREIAMKYGAHAVVNPLEKDPVEVYRGLAKDSQRLHVFEASGVKNLIYNMIDAVPHYTKFLIVGASMEDNLLKPTSLINKNITLDFITGPGYGETSYTALKETFEDLIAGKFDPSEIVTAYTGFDGVEHAFAALRPGGEQKIEQVKILIVPQLDGDGIYAPDQIELPKI
ncbi:zinc-binding dehydrogenase [Paenibacillus sp. FSL W8-0426]|uniref:zinc-binding dehydrogenase n=1 Tax=Paenibacillus sp. FSL W8-0426 TaxID=2921714 RepID=UPI0030DD04C3